MRILAASFETEAAAILAIDALYRSFPAGGRSSIAPLGTAGDARGPTTIVAGRFADDVIAAVHSAIRELGGTVVIDVDESRTHR